MKKDFYIAMCHSLILIGFILEIAQISLCIQYLFGGIQLSWFFIFKQQFVAWLGVVFFILAVRLKHKAYE